MHGIEIGSGYVNKRNLGFRIHQTYHDLNKVKHEQFASKDYLKTLTNSRMK